MIDIAYAMGQAGGSGGQGTSQFTAFIPLLIMFVIFYFLLIRPQQKKAKEHSVMLNNIKKGDKIITSGGIHGRVTGMDENTLIVEIADKVRVKLSRGNVATTVQSSSKDGSEKSEKKEPNE